MGQVQISFRLRDVGRGWCSACGAPGLRLPSAPRQFAAANVGPAESRPTNAGATCSRSGARPPLPVPAARAGSPDSTSEAGRRQMAIHPTRAQRARKMMDEHRCEANASGTI